MRNEAGQFILEAVLLMVIFMAIVFIAANWFRTQGILGQIVQGPWKSMAGMLQNSEWKPAAQGNQDHPSQHNRHITILGETP